MTQSPVDRRTFLSIGAIGIAGSVIGLRTGWAQNATPTDAAGTPHPAHIHAGTCDELGEVVFPLNDVAPLAAGATPAATPTAAGAGDVVAESTTEVEASLEDILVAEHAINVHESVENIGNYIACGNLTGPATDGALVITLEELNGSGYTGEAHLVDNGDGTTTVMVTLTDTGGAAGTPAAGHTGHGDGAADVVIDITNFAYDPDPVTIKVGQSVTWTNQDADPHTATAVDRTVLDSGTLNQGESFSQTFDTPGTYEYFCEFHPKMSGVITVEA